MTGRAGDAGVSASTAAAEAGAGGAHARVRLLQLASPALPIGAYSYSTGLETAIETGLVADDDGALTWIGDALALLFGRFDAPIAAAAHAAWLAGDADSLRRLNGLACAARETAELRLESEQMGYSLLRWIEAVLGDDSRVASPFDGGPVAVAVAWGIAGARLGLTAVDTLTALLWGFAENQIMVLLKAMPIGQIRGQRLLHALVPVVDRVAAEAAVRPPSSWSSSAPGLAIASSAHEVQYSRLFRS